MNQTVLYIPGNHAALEYAAEALRGYGIAVVDTPGADVTHLLLPVPSFEADGRIKGGGSIESTLASLRSNVTVLGGNLDHPALAGHRTADLLRDPFYVSENAAITAHCALKHILNALPVTLTAQRVLVIGWGRIGKCIGRLLRSLGADVTIAARKAADRAMAAALGYGTVDPSDLTPSLPQYRVIVNTAPAPVLTEVQAEACGDGCVKIDLASKRGIPGGNVLWARGLPGKDAPESSGALIAKTVLRLIHGKEQIL